MSRDYWNAIAARLQYVNHENLWRYYTKEVYRRLIDRWTENSKYKCTLKTDLYDEAISTSNLIPLLGQKSERLVGIDLSFEITRVATRKMIKEWNGWHSVVVSDIRNVSFKQNSFDQILSNSTLDHFPRKEDIIVSLQELWRILKPGGLLIITLDNPSNPIVFLRNLLPYRLLRMLGVIPFYMGVTVSKSELIRILESNGFKVCESTGIIHSPRILAVWTGYILDKIGYRRIKVHFYRLFMIFEYLEKFPIRYFTGYFIAVKAIKRLPENV